MGRAITSRAVGADQSQAEEFSNEKNGNVRHHYIICGSRNRISVASARAANW